MKIEPIMAETEMTTLEILNLKEGDVIVFNKNAASSESNFLPATSERSV